ncbi:MAG TPA: LysR family transcriptional regulator [Stellaceae bacterium]|nr:LysR family transcriptional regulator [Stellaceae bacterium]
MRGKEFGELSAFIAVAEHRNFTRAAKQLGISASTLSQTIRTLEERLGVRLLNRTTRSVVPTAAGDTLLARLRPVVDEIEAALESLNTFRDKPAGLLRLTIAPPLRFVLPPLLGKFLEQYPDIQLEIVADGANVDIVAQQFDAGIRVSNRIDRDMIAVAITDEWRLAIAGSPSYFARRGEPKTPEDLQKHSCIRLRLPNGAMLPWRFERGGKAFEVSVSGSLVANTDTIVERAVLGGIGLAQMPRAMFEDGIASGRLVSVLEPWLPVMPPFALYYPSRRQMPAALKALVDFLRIGQRKKVFR